MHYKVKTIYKKYFTQSKLRSKVIREPQATIIEVSWAETPNSCSGFTQFYGPKSTMYKDNA